MKTTKIEQGKLDINSFGGNCLTGALLSGCKLPDHFYNHRKDKVGDSNIIFSMIGMLSAGKSSFADITLFENDRQFKHAFELTRTPSQEALRQNLNTLAIKASTFSAVDDLHMKVLRKMSFSPIPCKSGNYFPLDIDVTPLDNSKSIKEGVSLTYKLFDGYAPIMAYLGHEGYLVDSEFRVGKQHCQKETPLFLEGVISRSKSLLPSDSKFLIRMDGGNDAAENLGVMSLPNVFWVVKRNMRQEPKEYWLEMAKVVGDLVLDDGYKRTYIGILSHTEAKIDKEKIPADIVFKVTETYATPEGQLEMMNVIEAETFWSNLPESPADVIELYHAHGTSEQFHSEFKTDMGVERLPSGKFATNKLVFQMAMIAFNLLRRIGVDMVEHSPESVKKKGVTRRKHRTVLQQIIYTGCQFIMKARQATIRFGKHCASYRVIQQLYEAYR